MISFSDVQMAAGRIAGKVLRTPAFYSDALSKAIGAHTTIKLDNLQATGAFKERGAANRLALLSVEERGRGVIAMSAGNHAQAVARHAALIGVKATIVMPKFTPASKVTRTAAWGANVVLHGDMLAEAAAHAAHLAETEGMVFIHPYDDPAVMAGQGTLALELLEDAPDLECLVLPIGGGGLISGCAVAAKAMNPNIKIYGVETSGYAAMSQRVSNKPVSVGGPTIAEGIAVRDVGEQPLAVIRDLVDDILLVSEHDVENAVALLVESTKQVAEGAGAAGTAGIMAYPHLFAGKRVGTTICGGNIDSRILANALLRTMLRDGRLLRLHMEIPDRPGVLADISTKIGESGGNIIEVSHERLFAAPSVQAAELQVMVEARDQHHAADIAASLAGSYVLRRI